MNDISNQTICVVGLGYVGLPLAMELSKSHKVIGYDVNTKRIEDLKNGVDNNDSMSKDELVKSSIIFSSTLRQLDISMAYIITVPTPLTTCGQPDLSFLEAAMVEIGGLLKKKDLVIIESTVYPGATEEFCIPLLERESNLKCTEDFDVGYSPERVNPGDNEHSIRKVSKVISATDPKALARLEQLYSSVVDAPIFSASSIKVAEASKLLENTQRDINIALMNEYSIALAQMGIDSEEVIKAAATKWNFINFNPGLVGGHCTSVDPKYFIHKAHEIGADVSLMESARKVNDTIVTTIANKVISKIDDGKKILILGATFKEDCPDLRNSKSLEIYRHLKNSTLDVSLFDPVAKQSELRPILKSDLLLKLPDVKSFDAVVVLVKHKEFYDYQISSLVLDNGWLFDIKRVFDKNSVGVNYWAL